MLACRNFDRSASGSAMSSLARSSNSRSSSVRLRAADSAQNGSSASRVSIRSASLILWPRISMLTEPAIPLVVGRWTNAPPARPALTRTRFCTSRMRNASRTVARLICVCLTSSRSAGSAVPSTSSPDRIRSRISRANTSDALGTSTGLSSTLERGGAELVAPGSIVLRPSKLRYKGRTYSMVILLPIAAERIRPLPTRHIPHVTDRICPFSNRLRVTRWRLKNHAGNKLRNSGRLLRAVKLDRVPHYQINGGVIHFRGVDKPRSNADAAASRNRRKEPHPVEPIVDAHLCVFDTVVGLTESGNQGKRQESVGNCSTVGTFGARAVRIDVNPLVIPRDIGERVDALLVDSRPVTDA